MWGRMSFIDRMGRTSSRGDSLRALDISFFTNKTGFPSSGTKRSESCIASEKAKIGQPEIAVGVFPPVAAALFPKIIGLKKTYELLLTGKSLNAKEAEAAGLVNIVLPVENFKAEVDKYLAEYLNKSRPVSIWTKRAIKAGLGLNFTDALKASEIIYLQGCMKTEDAVEGIGAFMEKRKPVWKDK